MMMIYLSKVVKHIGRISSPFTSMPNHSHEHSTFLHKRNAEGRKRRNT
uniref:Uncharacterized protein n=1 Tax=Arundo donax TaxID=35708 RepID=A0A0A8YQD7_ARUDO